MIELGKVQTLTVQRVKEFGVYVGEGVACLLYTSDAADE